MSIKNYFDKSRQPRRHSIVMAVGVAILAICLFMLSRIDNRFILSIDSMEFRNKTTFTIGAGSDLAIKSVPHDFMTISHTEEGFAWSIDNSRDSLCYYLINGENPNNHTITEASLVHSEFVTENGMRIPVDLRGKDIIDCATSFKDTQYSLLRNMVSLLNNDTISRMAKTDKGLASLIRKNPKNDRVEIIILDNRTFIDSVGYSYSGSTSQLESNRKEECKVQFFTVSDMTVRFEEADEDQFRIDDINYMVKPVLVTTEWGAGHFMFRYGSDNTISVNYPKGLTYVERLGTLEAISSRQSGIVTFKQDHMGYPVGDDIYFPTFSKSYPSTICHLVFKDNAFQLESNRKDTFLLHDGFHMVPTLQKASLSSGDMTINCRYGILGMDYISSYLFLPFLVFLLMMSSHLFIIRKSFINKCKNTTERASLYPSYLPALAIIALCYCVGKTMISFKLSYTYPYFEKLSGIIVISTSLTLLLFYLLSLFINYDFVQKSVYHDRGKQGAKIRLFTPGLVGIIGLVLSYIFIHLLDNGINHEVRAAYFSDEWFTYKLWNWTTLSGINDTHRSVFYTLFLTCCIVTIMLLIKATLSLFWKKTRIYSFLDTIDDWLDKLFKRVKSVENPFALYVLYLLKFVLLPAILIFIVGFTLKGNFATAFITLFSVIGLTRALSGINPKEGGILNAIEMLSASFLIMMVAFLPDHGYFTNYFGFFGAVLFFYFFMQKTEQASNSTIQERDRRKKEIKMMPRIGFLLLIIVLCAPFIYNSLVSSDTVNYNRSSRRFLMTTQFEQYRESGYRYADSDAEFMNIIFYYMNHTDGHDPLSNESHHLHPSISTGQSPVILNDVSLPSSFLSAYGHGAYVVYFMLLILLLYLVITYTLTGTATEDAKPFDRYSQWRILAVLMWTGSSLYLFMSYYGVLPFTGRLNPGFGVDAVGEALESCILLSFMSATTFMNKEIK